MTLDFAAARENMVENQVRTSDVTELSIQDAMRDLAREAFCPPGKAYLAYAELEVEYAPGWFLMQPRDVAKLIQALAPQAGQTALAIAAPYGAAILARLGLNVLALQPADATLDAVASALAASGVALQTGDLVKPPAGEGFDVILCEGAVSTVPESWLAALKPGGRLGVVVREGAVGKARLFVRSNGGGVAKRELFDANPPCLPGFTPAPAFVF